MLLENLQVDLERHQMGGPFSEPTLQLQNEGARVLGNGEPKTGAHGNPVLFLHPKDFCGTLIELEEVGG